MAMVSEQVLGQILHVETAHEAWVELERSYDGGDMVSYLDRVKYLANTLAAAGHPISTPDLVQITLNGLPKEYESLVTSITTSTTIEKLTFNGLYDLLLNQEKRIQILKSERLFRTNSLGRHLLQATQLSGHQQHPNPGHQKSALTATNVHSASINCPQSPASRISQPVFVCSRCSSICVNYFQPAQPLTYVQLQQTQLQSAALQLVQLTSWNSHPG
ncbi:hypothetical protein EJ110_NYTH12922 [Nymphaea thermarum]|nr:hypothetical protein EJ110_NYTH12922 [Nymphaea thermarum]